MDEPIQQPVVTDSGTKETDKSDEYLNNWKRERADFINYKKDESKRMEQFLKYASEDVILEVLEIVDDLELAVKELKSVGLEPIVKKFQELFKKYGVERIRIEGKFDPSLHEAVETETGGGKIVEIRAGYMMGDKLIRPVRVKIVK